MSAPHATAGRPTTLLLLVRAPSASEARDRGIPIRIGVNGGSLDPSLYEKYGGLTAAAMVESAMQEIAYFQEVYFNLIKISVKASNVPLMV